MANQEKQVINLSPQQNRCLQLLLQGQTAKKIALEMRLSHRTVEHYIAKIKAKLNCNSTKELIIKYYLYNKIRGQMSKCKIENGKSNCILTSDPILLTFV